MRGVTAMTIKFYLFILFILVWGATGIYGTNWYPKNKTNYPMIVFIPTVPIIPILAYFAGIF